MTKYKRTLITFLLDETGSMSVCRDTTISGFNEYIHTMQQEDGEFLFTLTKFDSNHITTVHDAIPIAYVPDLTEDTYTPGAMTPLYDAIAQVIHTAEKSAKKKTAVLCVIMTDGQENASKEWNHKRIFDLVKTKEGDGWTFAFLGANQDAWATGESIGIHGQSTMSYKSGQEVTAFSGLAQASVAYSRSGSQPTSSFFVTGTDGDDEPNDSQVNQN